MRNEEFNINYADKYGIEYRTCQGFIVVKNTLPQAEPFSSLGQNSKRLGIPLVPRELISWASILSLFSIL